MWFPQVEPDTRWLDAITHLRKDKTLSRIIDRFGPCTLRPTHSRDHYIRLVQSILSQQVSVKAAASMYTKLAANFPRKRPTPDRMMVFLSTSDEATLRSCGLSRQKRAYVHDLARRIVNNDIDLRTLDRQSDQQIIDHLTRVKGIGQWTVEMLLIFALNRPDVWPVDDLAIRESVFRHWPRKFKERPTPKPLIPFADKWRPYRSIASWYLWRGLKTDA
jgi:DNA-3-methyladenine glycosylase II